VIRKSCPWCIIKIFFYPAAGVHRSEETRWKEKARTSTNYERNNCGGGMIEKDG
jgi:hypothetical protein